MPDDDTNAWEESLIADLRANGGKPSSGPLAGHPLALLYTTGAKSGERRRSIVTYSRQGEDYVVAGTNGGADVDPAWVGNVRKEPTVELEVASEVFAATATIAEPGDRERLWSEHVAQLPWFGKYEQQVHREIPVVTLRRTA